MMADSSHHSKGKTSSLEEKTEGKGFIENEVVDKITDSDLIQYSFHYDFEKNADKNHSMFFDTVSEVPITNLGTFDYQQALGAKNTRWITFNIPAIDALSRSNPFVRKSTNYLSSKPLIYGIDINTIHNDLKSEELFVIQNKLKTLYKPLKETGNKGITYGGAAGLIWIKGQTSSAKLKEPLDIRTVRKSSFLGIKPLARWFQVEPALDKGLITEVGPGTGFRDASVLGMPMYYNVNLSGGLAGDGDRKDYLVHASRLLLYQAEIPSFIETQIERFWGPSIVELAWNELRKDSRLWDATTKSAEKNNMGVLKIKGLSLAGQVNKNVQNRINARLSLIKQGSSKNVLPIDESDDFQFVNAALNGNSDVIRLSNSRLAGAFRVPVSVLFPNEKGDAEDKSYIQSLSQLEDEQERIYRVWFETLLPIIIKSEIGRKVEYVSFKFNPIETLTTKEKAEIANTNMKTIEMAYVNGFTDKSGGIKMMDDVNKNPEFLAQSINERYRREVLDKAEKGVFETYNSDQINIARELNQISKDQVKDNIKDKKGKSGVKNPLSEKGKVEGGDPTKSKGVLKKNVLNRQKAKE